MDGGWRVVGCGWLVVGGDGGLGVGGRAWGSGLGDGGWTAPSLLPCPRPRRTVRERLRLSAPLPLPFGSIGRFTTEEEVDYAVAMCVRHVKRLREMSPLWEMVQEGVDIKAVQWASH